MHTVVAVVVSVHVCDKLIQSEKKQQYMCLPLWDTPEVEAACCLI